HRVVVTLVSFHVNYNSLLIFHMLNRHASYYVGLGFGVMLCSFIEIWAFVTSSARQTTRIRKKFFFSVLHQEMGWFDTIQTGTLNTRLTDDINTIHEGIGIKIGIIIEVFSTFVSGIIIAFAYGWKLTLVTLCIAPLLVASGFVWSYLLAVLTTKELLAYAKAGAVAEEVLSAIRTVVAFNGQAKAMSRYDSNLEEARTVGMKKTIAKNITMGISKFVVLSGYALGFWYGTKLSVDEKNNYSIGVLVDVFLGSLMFAQIFPNVENVSNARGAAYEVFKVIKKPCQLDSSSGEGFKPDKLRGEIEFKNISFSYPSRPDVLKGLNLKIQPGKTIAVVGSSGCGKSTTIQLLQRFYDPVEGQVTIDGHDIRTLNIKWLRENIGIVSQEPVLFGTTIAGNIRYGREDITDAEIEQAAKEANAYDFISKLPDRFNTMVGERGAQLSGGQKQRIAIARALARNPKILLLDEATSALDTQSESIVQAALDKARTGRTTIVIAHRLSTIRTADVIVGFAKGVLAEQGTHEELMAQKGIYHDLVMQQVTRDTDFEEEEVENSEKDDQDNPETNDLENPVAGTELVNRRRTNTYSIQKLPEVPYSRILALNKPEFCYIVVGVIAAAIGGCVSSAFAFLVGKIIGVFEEQDVVKKSQNATMFSLFFLLLGAISLITYIVQVSSRITPTSAFPYLALSRCFRDIGWFDDPKNGTGILLTRLATDASQVKGATGSWLALLILTTFAVGSAVVVALAHGWQVTLLIMACMPVFAGLQAICVKFLTGYVAKDQKALHEAGRISTEAIENIRTVAALTSEDTFFEKYKASLEVPYRDSLKKALLISTSYAIAQGSSFFVHAIIFRFGAWAVSHCFITSEQLFIVFVLILFASLELSRANSLAPDFGKSKIAAQRIFQLLDHKPLIDSYSERGEKLEKFEGNIEFRDVHFVYPARAEVQVLQGLSIQVTKGQTLALVGSSGCGKSTSIQLLERFYDPRSGQVLADGVDTKCLHIQWFRSRLGLVQQEPVLFDCSIAENIQYGDNSRVVSQEEVEAAAKAANIHQFIFSLPEKYNTRVGDNGVQLSGGQKQRIAIARALVRKPEILLLDEATSALDTESEKIVQQALDEARKGRTCIVIAHRLSTIQTSDIIAVICNGKVMEHGTHNQLLTLKGFYYALVNAQVSH
uniref:ABC-type xenobiotic transporter n=1 Tax=Varanus komodoensis TaxID=61221 RepID=A0A8D2LX38_VARKO